MAEFFAIGAVYEHQRYGTVTATHIVGVPPIAVVVERDPSSWTVPVDELYGPTELPCPECGELQSVREQLSEHLQHCVAVAIQNNC